MINRRILRAAAAAAVFSVAACAGRRAAVKKDPETSVRPPAAATDAARIADVEPEVRDMNLRAVPELKEVRFNFDSDRLDDVARSVLRSNAAYLRAHAAMKVQVSGHCDQRGTVAYNLALGQRRARSVRDYLKALGVEPARVATISWGREHPVCSLDEESCWERNRRAETLEAVPAAVAGSPR